MTTKVIPAELTPILQNRYWREHDATLILAAWRQSGLTLSAFARQCGLSAKRLRRWQARLDTDGSLQFHPVALSDLVRRYVEPAALEDNGIEVLIGSGRRLVVRRGFDRDLLLELVEALESC